jgi:hypothetical protein
MLAVGLRSITTRCCNHQKLVDVMTPTTDHYFTVSLVVPQYYWMTVDLLHLRQRGCHEHQAFGQMMGVIVTN